MREILRHTISLISFAALLLIAFFTQGQPGASVALQGKSKITHYTKEDFGYETQFWSMAEDSLGTIYFGTNRGISILNGQEWTHLEISNGSSMNAVAVSHSGEIIAGGYNEFGKVIRDSIGHFHYQSMLDLLSSEEVDFEMIWEIEMYKEMIFLRSFSSIIIISNNKATVIPNDGIFRSVDLIEDKVLVTNQNGINELDTDSFELHLLVDASSYNNEQLIRILPYSEGQAIIFTREGYSYIFNYSTNKVTLNRYHFNKNNKDEIFCAARARNGLYLLGTINNKIKFFDPNNPTYEHFRDDIQDKTVLNIVESNDGNIWAMLNRGVDCINTSFPGTTIFDNTAIYDTEIFNNHLYLATNQGAFVSRKEIDSYGLSTSDFKLIGGLAAQAWSVQAIGDQIMVGHDKGAFFLDETNEAHRVNLNAGVWKFMPIDNEKDKLIACAYDGMYLLKKNGDGYRYVQKIKNFDESSRDIMPGKRPGEYWICHGYKGVYHLKVNNDYTEVVSREHYTKKNGLPTTYGINVSRYNDQIIFLSAAGPYYYSDSLNQFLPHEELQQIFRSNPAVTNITQYMSTVWFIQDNSMGFFSLSNPEQLNKSIFSALDGTFITNMEHISPLNSQTVMVGTNAGLYVFRHVSANKTNIVPTLITGLSYKLPGDSLVNINLFNQGTPPALPNFISSLKFKYAAPRLNAQKDVRYRYKLENFHNSWSDWSGNYEREFSYLKPGNYIFRVEAMDHLNNLSSEASFAFEILPPWYLSRTFIGVFIILGMLIIAGIVLFIRKRYKNYYLEESRLRKLLELELEQVKLEQTNELILKDKESLEEDIINKSKEIANYTLLLVNKHELMNEVKETLNLIKKDARLEKTRESIRRLSQKISNNLRDEEHLKVFDTNFERVHQEFFDELKAKFPDLSQKELRMCGFVKMNMSNKEIASILNISVRGVETARYRIRKRLSVHHDTNLSEFLDQLASPTKPEGLEID